MNEPRNLEQLQADVEARQRNILWEDARLGGKSETGKIEDAPRP
jgi:hypothetical protein